MEAYLYALIQFQIAYGAPRPLIEENAAYLRRIILIRNMYAAERGQSGTKDYIKRSIMTA